MRVTVNSEHSIAASPAVHLFSRHWSRWIALGVVGILIAQIAALHSLRHDDAYITFRYSQNLANGEGLVFNVGERIMGSTAPGYALLGAIFYRFVPRDVFPSLMCAVGCVGWTLQSLALGSILAKDCKDRAAFIALCVAVGGALSYRLVALETNIAAALGLWAVERGLRGKWLAAAALCSLAGFTRPDAYLYGVPLAVLGVRDLGWRSLWPGAVGAAISAPWFVFSWGYFGTIIPQSAVAKLQSVPATEYSRILLNYTTSSLSSMSMSLDYLSPIVSPWRAGLVGALAVAGAVFLVRTRTRLIVLPVILSLHAVAYMLLRASVGIEWHLYPIGLMTIVLVLATIYKLASLIASGERAKWVILALPVVLFSYRTAQFARAQPDAYWYGARDQAYRNVADYLNAHASANDAVVSDEVGTVAYYTGLRMIDTAGLVTRDSAFALAGRAPRWNLSSYGEASPFPRMHKVYRARSAQISSEEMHLPRAKFFTVCLFNDSVRTHSQP